jgi:flavin reductase (DIM6/NTAB) family NADH-FMN oxidoreductase RutF
VAANLNLTRRAADGVNAERLRAAMGHFATGVSVVTSSTGDGRPIGSTANALTSVSLDPPLILACLREESETLAALLTHEYFAINLLGDEQTPLAKRFAGRTTEDTWQPIGHRATAHGVPLLNGAMATLECRLHDVADGGDHRIVIGQVLDVSYPDTHIPPLVFYRGEFSRLQTPRKPRGARRGAPGPAPAAFADVFIPTLDGDISLVPVEPQSSTTTSVIALVGQPRASSGALVYLHRGCLLGDALGHLHCRRHLALERALEQIREAGAGVVVYHRDDRFPFAGCCAADARSNDRAAPAADEPLAMLREAIAGLELRAVRLLSRDTESDPLPAGPLGLDVAVVEPLALDD